jgi:hypothetical protein
LLTLLALVTRRLLSLLTLLALVLRILTSRGFAAPVLTGCLLVLAAAFASLGLALLALLLRTLLRLAAAAL